MLLYHHSCVTVLSHDCQTVLCFSRRVTLSKSLFREPFSINECQPDSLLKRARRPRLLQHVCQIQIYMCLKLASLPFSSLIGHLIINHQLQSIQVFDECHIRRESEMLFIIFKGRVFSYIRMANIIKILAISLLKNGRQLVLILLFWFCELIDEVQDE